MKVYGKLLCGGKKKELLKNVLGPPCGMNIKQKKLLNFSSCQERNRE